MTRGPSASARLVAGAAFAILSVLLAGTVWIVPYLPTNDGPEWVYATHMENHYADPGSPYPEVYVPALQFAARGFTALYDPLEAMFGWQRGLQVALTIVVLASAWAFAVMVVALDRRRWPLAFLGFPLALSWPFYMGFWAFSLGTALGFVVIAMARRSGSGWRGGAVLAAMLLVQAVVHVFPAVLTGAAVLALAAAGARAGDRLKATARAAAIGIPAACVLLASMLTSREARTLPFATTAARLPMAEALSLFPRTLAPGPSLRADLVTLGVLVAAGAGVYRATRDTVDPAVRGLSVCAGALLCAGFFAPTDIPGWQGFAPRFVPLGAALALALLPIERLTAGWDRLAAPALFACAIAWLAPSYPFHYRLAGLTRDAFAGVVAKAARPGTMLPVTLHYAEEADYDPLHAEVPRLSPLLHMGALYAAVGNARIPYAFSSSPATYPFTLREATAKSVPIPGQAACWDAIDSGLLQHNPAFRADFDDRLADFGRFYDSIVVTGAREGESRRWRDRGFVIDWESRSAFVAHFERGNVAQ